MVETDEQLPEHQDETSAERSSLILGRLAKAVREQNWFSVGLELVIVVLGVVIGFQVTAWGQARSDQARGRGYLERIREDLRADTDAIDTRLAYYALVADYAEVAVAHIETGTLRNDSPWATVVSYYHASQVLPFTSTRRTFDEMREAGDLRLIRDPTLRADLGAYYNESQITQGGWLFQDLPTYRERVRGLTPIQVQRYIVASCEERRGIEQILVDCDAPISTPEARALLDRYRAAPGLAEDLRYWVSTIGIITTILPVNRAEAEALTARVSLTSL
ncbi:MAG: hypothetical protein R2834_21665 [Rhodothermales bacterium]